MITDWTVTGFVKACGSHRSCSIEYAGERLRICLICATLLLGQAGFSYTWYVDASHPGPYGGSAANPFKTITNALHSLAETNTVEGTNGGHVICVAPGTYTDPLAMTDAHSGVLGTNNYMFGTNAVIQVGPSETCIHMTHTLFVTVDGFNLTGGQNGLWLSSPSANRISGCEFRYCNIYSNGRYGIYLYTYRGVNGYPDLIEHCNIYGNGLAGVGQYYWTDCHVKNCVIVGNSGGGVTEARTPTWKCVSNCVFYGNGLANYYDSDDGMYDTAEEINALPECDSNIVANPGFVYVASNWNFSVFYTNSPCLNAADDGSHVGVCQDPLLVGYTSEVFHVDAGTGDDSRSTSQAMDPATPWASLTNASRHVFAGDTVVVGAGIYTQQVFLTVCGSRDAPITFMADGEVTVDGTGNDSCFHFDRVSDVILSGFTCSRSGSDGIRFTESCCNTVRNCRICSNTVYGVMLRFSSCNTVTESVICSNKNTGVYIYDCANNVISRNAIYDNNVYGGYVGAVTYQSTRNNIFANCNVYSNGNHAVCAWTYAAVTVENCVLWGNGGDGVNGNVVAYCYVTNCVIGENQGIGIREPSNASFPSYSYYNCFYTNVTGNFHDTGGGGTLWTAADINAVATCSDNIVGDPLLRGAPVDCAIRFNSPCRNAGSTGTSLTVDFYGNPRPVGTACDIGSYEMRPAGIVLYTY